ncbi:MAG: hypothetical protein WAU01_04225 [Saprospiraceae bacterium]
MKNNIAIIILTLFTLSACAQKYNTLVGIRIADDFGVSFAQRIANKTTMELNIQPGTFAGNQLASVLVKQHYPLLTKRFNFFMGGGLYSGKATFPLNDVPTKQLTSGMALSFGAEFSIGNLSIATDYMPLVSINKNDNNQRFYTTSGLSLRYILVGRESSTRKFFRNLFKKKK